MEKETRTMGQGREVLEALLATSWGERLRLVHLLISVGAMLQADGEGWMIVLLLVVNLLCAWTRFMRCGIYVRLERLWSLETDKINTKNDCSMETKTMDAEMMRGLFSGANFSGEVQIVVAPKGKVVFKEAVSGERGAVSGEQPKATDEQVANALMAINGKGKPLSNYQTWLGGVRAVVEQVRFPTEPERMLPAHQCTAGSGTGV